MADETEVEDGAGEKPALSLPEVTKPAGLPATLPVAVPPTLSRFGPAAVDFQINKSLESIIPAKEKTAILDVKLTGRDGSRVITGIVAVRGEGGWGAALGTALDLNDRRNYEVEIVAVKSWG